MISHVVDRKIGQNVLASDQIPFDILLNILAILILNLLVFKPNLHTYYLALAELTRTTSTDLPPKLPSGLKPTAREDRLAPLLLSNSAATLFRNVNSLLRTPRRRSRARMASNARTFAPCPTSRSWKRQQTTRLRSISRSCGTSRNATAL